MSTITKVIAEAAKAGMKSSGAEKMEQLRESWASAMKEMEADLMDAKTRNPCRSRMPVVAYIMRRSSMVRSLIPPTTLAMYDKAIEEVAQKLVEIEAQSTVTKHPLNRIVTPAIYSEAIYCDQ